MRRCFYTLLLLLFFYLNSSAQIPVQSYNISLVIPTGTTNSSTGWGTEPEFETSVNYKNYYGETQSGGKGKERVIATFIAGGFTYIPVVSSNGKPFDKVVVKRHPLLSGLEDHTLYEYSSQAGTNNYFEPSYLGSLEEVMNSYACNRGSDNTFSNPNTGNSTYSNVERVDLIKTNAITSIIPVKQGFLINERNGNDNFKVAAITSIDGSGNVASLGNLVAAKIADYGRVGPVLLTTVMSRNGITDPELRPKQNIPEQTISGIFFSFANLGIPVGAKAYGIAIFPNDVTDAMDLVNLTNVPIDTDGASGRDGGMDLMAGCSYSIEASVLAQEEYKLKATPKDNSVELSWESTFTDHVQHYEIEKLVGNSWVKLGQKAAVNDTAYNYFFDDALPDDGKNYYRLRSVKINGDYKYSPVAVASISKEINIKIYPNPADKFFNVNIGAKAYDSDMTIEIFQSDGKKVRAFVIKAGRTGNFVFNIADLSMGIYSVVIKEEGILKANKMLLVHR